MNIVCVITPIAFYEVEVNRFIVQLILTLDNLITLVTWLSQNFGIPNSDIHICFGTLNDKTNHLRLV